MHCCPPGGTAARAVQLAGVELRLRAQLVHLRTNNSWFTIP